MTQTIREQLQELVDRYDRAPLTASAGWVIGKLEAILAVSQPSPSVKPGWVCKDNKLGIFWSDMKPIWDDTKRTWLHPRRCIFLYQAITDPWPNKPNGGPECLMEVR